MIARKHAWIRTILAASACLAIALPNVASAESFRHGDPAHDVVWEGTGDTTPANRSADITRVRFTYARWHLRTMMKVRQYGAGKWSLWDFSENIQTPTATYYVWIWMHRGEGYRVLRIQRGVRGGEHYCRGMSAKPLPRRDRILVSIPTRCIHGPRWVRVGFWYKVYPNASGVFPFEDNPLRKGNPDAEAMTPRLRRG